VQHKQNYQRPVEELMNGQGRLEVHPFAEPQHAAERKARPYVYYYKRQQQPTAEPGEFQKVVVKGLFWDEGRGAWDEGRGIRGRGWRFGWVHLSSNKSMVIWYLNLAPRPSLLAPSY
jgi:hypothetical protein